MNSPALLPPVILVAHGQPGDPAGQQRAVESMAAEVSTLLGGRDLRGATLAAPGALEAAVAPDALVYPLFMAGGWFTRVELPRRLSAAGATDLRILPPFGADPELPALCLSLLEDTARDNGWQLSGTGLLIAGHGSGRSRAPAQAVQDLAERLLPHVARIACGFVEEPPLISEAARGFTARAICLPFFATHAEHVRDDLPRALAQAQFEGVVLPPLGLAPEVPTMIARAIARADEG